MLNWTQRYILAALALLPLGAAAALTEEDAVRIGRAADVQGLRTLIAERNQGLLFRALNSWNLREARELPPALEALAVEHYADPVAQRPLIGHLGNKIDSERSERYPKYRSRKLFDLLYADLKARKDTHHYAIRIVSTDLPVEAELAALLPALDPAGAQELVMFLGARKYAPAVPALQALQARVSHDANVNQMLERVDWALLQIGTPQASQALLERLRALGRMSDPRAGFEVWNILLTMARLPAGSLPDYADLRAALPAQLNESAWPELVRLIAVRREKRGVPELRRAIKEHPASAAAAIDALLAVGDPADWRAARADVAAPLRAKLDEAIADPARYAAKLEQQEGEQRLSEERRRVAALKASDPARYATETRALLHKREALLRQAPESPRNEGTRQDLVRDYVALGAYLRFQRGQPDEALAAYREASRLLAGGLDLGAIGMADISRFEKRDARKALEHYRVALGKLASTGRSGQEEQVLAGMKQWLEREIDYVQSGKRFVGLIRTSDMSAAYLWLMVAGMHERLDPRADPRTLQRLPPSQFQLARAYPGMFDLPPTEMLAFFGRHDPAGYLTAAILSVAVRKEASPYVIAAAETFFRSRGMRSPLNPASADPRYGTPEKTWAAFLSAAKKGDAAAMLDCFTPPMQARLEALFKRLSPEELRGMGASFIGFSMQGGGGEHREAAIVRQQQDRKMAGFVSFVNDGGAWKIDGM